MVLENVHKKRTWHVALNHSTSEKRNSKKIKYTCGTGLFCSIREKLLSNYVFSSAMNPLCFWNKGFLLSTENFLENKQNTFFYFGAKTELRRPRSGTQTVPSIAYHTERELIYTMLFYPSE